MRNAKMEALGARQALRQRTTVSKPCLAIRVTGFDVNDSTVLCFQFPKS